MVIPAACLKQVRCHVNVVMNKVVEARLETVEDEVRRTYAELDQLAQEANVLDLLSRCAAGHK